MTSQPDTSAPLLGEPVPVELMNTVWANRSGIHDALLTDAGVLRWLRAVHPRLAALDPSLESWLVSKQPSGLSDAGAQLRLLRDALRRLAAQQTQDPRPSAASPITSAHEALFVLNQTSAAAPHWSSIESAATGAARRIRQTDAASGAAIASVFAESAIDLFTGTLRGELRACLAPGCVLYFVKQHPRREWCSTACGNRARAARHYQRHRAPSGPRRRGAR